MATPNPKTITSANAVFLLGVTNLYSTPVQLQGFATDAMFMTESADQAETYLGVDGIMSAGWIPQMYEQTITFQANSASIAIFDNWRLQQNAMQELFNAFATISITGTGNKYSLSNGVLKSATVIPEAAKTLRPRAFKITWNTITVANQ